MMKSGPSCAIEMDVPLSSSCISTSAECPVGVAMNEKLLLIARDYAECHGVILREPLGFGIHGIVFAVQSKAKQDRSAIKFHEHSEPYHREKSIYQRLADQEVTEIEEFHVPQLLGFDDVFLAIEMTIVKAPFVLDFAGAYLEPPEFPDSVTAEWEKEKQEQFGARWNSVEKLIQAFQDLNIYLLDVSPSNVAFRDEKE